MVSKWLIFVFGPGPFTITLMTFTKLELTQAKHLKQGPQFVCVSAWIASICEIHVTCVGRKAFGNRFYFGPHSKIVMLCYVMLEWKLNWCISIGCIYLSVALSLSHFISFLSVLRNSLRYTRSEERHSSSIHSWIGYVMRRLVCDWWIVFNSQFE